jgi:hypothetical protein
MWSADIENPIPGDIESVKHSSNFPLLYEGCILHMHTGRIPGGS